MKILVTGGAGFIGSHLVNLLLNHTNYEVVIVDNFNDYYNVDQKEYNVLPFLSNDRCKIYREDICDYEKMKEVFEKEKPNKIVHLAALAGVRESIDRPLDYEKVNLGGTTNLLELSRLYDVKNFVYASSSSVYGNQKSIPFSEDDVVDEPISMYAATKKAGENIAYTYHHLHKLPITCLRFFTVYGPSGRPDMAPYKFTKMIHEGIPLTKYGDGTSQRDYTYVEDIVAGVFAALEKNLDFEVINIGNSELTSLNDFIALIERLVGKKAIIKQLGMQPGDVDITYSDISKAEKLLGYKPKTSFEEGMEKFVKWYMESPFVNK